MKKLALLTLAVCLTVASALALSSPGASADVDVRSDAAANQFPEGIQFTIFFASDVPVTEARLRFRILPDGVNATVRPECTTGAVINCRAVIGSTAQGYMVPGAEVVYSWQITDEAGETFTTEERTTVYEDNRFNWESLTEENLTVFYYFGDEASQRAVLDAARETVERISSLLDTEVDFPVKIWVYQTARDLQPAVASRRGQGNDDTIRTLGEVGASDTALVSRDTEFLDVVRHELAHVVTRAATRGHLVDIPIWINEGISTYSQNALLPGEEAALRVAIQRDGVLPITSLGASSRGTGGVVSLFYAQSGSIVTYLIETYGEQQFGDFVKALARDNINGALDSIYGFDLLGLENEWRQAVGLPEVGSGSGQPSQDAVPTATPAGSSQQEPQPTSVAPRQPQGADSDDGGISLMSLMIGLSVVLVVLLGTTAALVLRSRSRSGA